MRSARRFGAEKGSEVERDETGRGDAAESAVGEK